MLYKPLFELNIFHNYYRDKVCPDLSIEPTSECSRILGGHRLILKYKVNGIVVIAPVDSEHKPWVELADNLRFTFILQIKNLDFLDFTDIDWQPVDNIIYIDNIIYLLSNDKNTQNGVSDLEITRTRLPGSAKEVVILAIFRLIAIFLLIRKKLYRFVLLFRLSDRKLPKGQKIFGIVDIYHNSSLPKVLHQGSKYKITFKAKKQQWRYYLVTPAVSKENQVLIKDDNEFLIKDNDEKRQKKIKFIKYTPKDDKEADTIFSVLKQQFPGSQQYRFISEEKITCQESGIQNIQLLNKNKCTGDKGKVWIKHLPNPPNRNGIHIINALKDL